MFMASGWEKVAAFMFLMSCCSAGAVDPNADSRRPATDPKLSLEF